MQAPANVRFEQVSGRLSIIAWLVAAVYTRHLLLIHGFSGLDVVLRAFRMQSGELIRVRYVLAREGGMSGLNPTQ